MSIEELTEKTVSVLKNHFRFDLTLKDKKRCKSSCADMRPGSNEIKFTHCSLTDEDFEQLDMSRVLLEIKSSDGSDRVVYQKSFPSIPSYLKFLRDDPIVRITNDLL